MRPRSARRARGRGRDRTTRRKAPRSRRAGPAGRAPRCSPSGPRSISCRSRARAASGAPLPGWPTSMWTMSRPASSAARAASITSITIKGSTSDRVECRMLHSVFCEKSRGAGFCQTSREEDRQCRAGCRSSGARSRWRSCWPARPWSPLAQTIIRDAEIERALQELAAPVFPRGRLAAEPPRVIIINDGSMNAFVADARAHLRPFGPAVAARSVPTSCRRCWPMRRRISPTGTLTARSRAAAGFGPRRRRAWGCCWRWRRARPLWRRRRSDRPCRRRHEFGAAQPDGPHPRRGEASAGPVGPALHGVGGYRPGGDARGSSTSFAGRRRCRSGRQDPYVRSHPLTRDRYRTVQAFPRHPGDRRGAIGRQRILVRKAQRQAFGLPAQSLVDAAPRGPKRYRRDRDAEPGHRPSPYAGCRPRAGRGGTPAADAAGRSVLPGASGTDPVSKSRRFDAAIAAYGRAVELAPREPLILAGGMAGHCWRRTAPRAIPARSMFSAGRRPATRSTRACCETSRWPMRAPASRVWPRRSPRNATRFLDGWRDAAALANRAVGLLPQGSPGWIRRTGCATRGRSRPTTEMSA